MKTNLSPKNIPIDKITISKLESIFKETLTLTFNGNRCVLRLNPHHTGYSYTTVQGIKYPAHRVIRAVMSGHTFSDLVTDHLCRNRSCIRPAHLEIVTMGENVRRGTAWHHWLGQKHCKYGHVLSSAYIRPNGTRACKACHARRERVRRSLYAKSS